MGLSYGEGDLWARLRCLDIIYGHSVKLLNTNRWVELPKREKTIIESMPIDWSAIDVRFRNVVECYDLKGLRAVGSMVRHLIGFFCIYAPLERKLSQLQFSLFIEVYVTCFLCTYSFFIFINEDGGIHDLEKLHQL